MRILIILILCIYGVTPCWSQTSTRHDFVEREYKPTKDHYCFRDDGYLRITQVTHDSLHIDAFVMSKIYEGAVDGMAYIHTRDNAQLILDEGDEYEAKFDLFLSPDGEDVFLKCEGGCIIWSGVGVCLEGFYKSNIK